MSSCHELIKNLYGVETNEANRTAGLGRINCRSRWERRKAVGEEISRIIAGRNAAFRGTTAGAEKAV